MYFFCSQCPSQSVSGGVEPKFKTVLGLQEEENESLKFLGDANAPI